MASGIGISPITVVLLVALLGPVVGGSLSQSPPRDPEPVQHEIKPDVQSLHGHPEPKDKDVSPSSQHSEHQQQVTSLQETDTGPGDSPQRDSHADTAQQPPELFQGQLPEWNDPEDGNANVRTHQDKRYVDSIAAHLLKKSVPLEQKRYIDAINGYLLKKSSPKNKRYIDSIAGELLKKSHPSTDTFSGNAFHEDNKRYVDAIAGDLLKRSYLQDHQHDIEPAYDQDSTQSGINGHKRYVDSITGDLLKRHGQADTVWSDKIFTESVANDLRELTDEDRNAKPDPQILQSLKLGQLESEGVDDARLLGQPHVKGNKRYIDSINGDLLKRPDPQTFEYKSNPDGRQHSQQSSVNNQKRYVDSITGVLLKRFHDTENIWSDKNVVNSVSGKLKEMTDHDDIAPGVDNHVMESLTPSQLENDGVADPGYMGNSQALDTQQSNRPSDADLKSSYPLEDKRHIDSITGDLLKKSKPFENKRYIDSIAGDLLKKSHPFEDKRYIDSIAGELLKKSHPLENKRYIDSIAGELLKKSHPMENKRYVDSIAGFLLKKSDSQEHKRFIDSITGDLLKKKDVDDKRYIDSISGDLLKRKDVDDKRYIDSVAGNLLKRSHPVEYKQYIDSIAGDLLKRSPDSESRGDVYDDNEDLETPASWQNKDGSYQTIQHDRNVLQYMSPTMPPQAQQSGNEYPLVESKQEREAAAKQYGGNLEEITDEDNPWSNETSVKSAAAQLPKSSNEEDPASNRPLIQSLTMDNLEQLALGHNKPEEKRLIDSIHGDLLKRNQPTSNKRQVGSMTRTLEANRQDQLQLVKDPSQRQVFAADKPSPDDIMSKLTSKSLEDYLTSDKDDLEQQLAGYNKDGDEDAPMGVSKTLGRQYLNSASSDEPRAQEYDHRVTRRRRSAMFLPSVESMQRLLGPMRSHGIRRHMSGQVGPQQVTGLGGYRHSDNPKRFIELIASHIFKRFLHAPSTAFIPPILAHAGIFGNFARDSSDMKEEARLSESDSESQSEEEDSQSAADYLKSGPQTAKRYIDPINGYLLKRSGDAQYDDDSDSSLSSRPAGKRLTTYDRQKLEFIFEKSYIQLLNSLEQAAERSRLNRPASRPRVSGPITVGQAKKRFWMDRPLVDSISGDLLKRQDSNTSLQPTKTPIKRFWAPNVWQMLMKKSLYNYGGNYVDSIAGDLLKRDNSAAQRQPETESSAI